MAHYETRIRTADRRRQFSVIVMAGRVPAIHPQSVDAPQTLYNRRCAGSRDTPGYDDFQQ
jgi:hypothetical protein